MRTQHFVRVIVKDEANRYIVVHHRSDGFMLWNFPGGKVEEGESIVEAGARELEEEIGVKVIGLTKICEKKVILNGDIWIGHFLFAHCIAGHPVINEPTKATSMCSFRVNELCQLPSIPALLVDVARSPCVTRLMPTQFSPDKG